MTKETYYMYLGTNGTITSPVHLEDIYYTLRYKLTAGAGKVLTKDGTQFVKTAMVPEADLASWKEVEEKQFGQSRL